MKVWQLINELSMYPAGKDVQISPLKGDYVLVPTSLEDQDTSDISTPIIIFTRKD